MDKIIPHHPKGTIDPAYDKAWKIKSCSCGNKIHVFQKHCSECIKELFREFSKSIK